MNRKMTTNLSFEMGIMGNKMLLVFEKVYQMTQVGEKVMTLFQKLMFHMDGKLNFLIVVMENQGCY